MKHILMVDDDETFRNRLLRAFEKRGLRAFAAFDLASSLEIARLHALDFAVVDLRLAASAPVLAAANTAATAATPVNNLKNVMASILFWQRPALFPRITILINAAFNSTGHEPQRRMTRLRLP